MKPPSLEKIQGHEGLALSAMRTGDPNGVPVLMLHGGGQTRHAWSATADRVANLGYQVLSADLRGHGDSGWSSSGDYGMGTFANDVRALVGWLGAPAFIIGASHGGLAALVAAGEAPSLPLRGLVLVDITPKLDQDGSRRITAFMNGSPNGFANVDEAADAVAEYLPHRPRPADPSGLLRNLRRGADGRLRWHWDPKYMAAASAESSNALEDRLETAAARIKAPTLLVRGKMSEIVSEDSVSAFRRVMPHAEVFEVSGAAHMVAGDRNDVFNSSIIEFLRRH